MLLREAEYLLLQDCVTENDIQKSEVLMKMFLRDFGALYSRKSLTYNLHNLIHHGSTVRRIGPLSSNSAFPWEDYTGAVQQRIHGPKNQGIELVKTIQLYQGLPVLKARVELSSENRGDHPQENATLRDEIKGHRFTEEEKRLLASSMLNPEKIFYGAIGVSHGCEVFTCRVFSRQKIKNNYTICFTEESGIKRYGEISCFSFLWSALMAKEWHL